MGCDGGTIPKRDELVRTKKRAEQKDKVAERSFLWRHCSLSQTPLRQPVVACGLGRLYNKDSVILALLEKESMPRSARHIKSLQDVKCLNLMANPNFEDGIENGDGYVDHLSSPYICPVVGLEMNGKFKFCFPWSCGCVVSERAMKQIKSNLCHKCQRPIDSEDIVILNPMDEDCDLMKTRLEARLIKRRDSRKFKRVKGPQIRTIRIINDKHPQENEASTSSASSTTADNNVEIKTKPNEDDKVKIKTEPNGDTQVKIKTENSANKVGLKRPADGLAMKSEDFKKTKESYSVAQDPQASTVYKSLFTSSNQAQNQMKAHWVTYNPFYN